MGNGKKQSGEQIGKCPLRAALACISFLLEREVFVFIDKREPLHTRSKRRVRTGFTVIDTSAWEELKKKHCSSASLYARTLRHEARGPWPVAQRGVYAEYWTSANEGSSTIGTHSRCPSSKSGISATTNVMVWKHSSPSPTANSHDYGIRDH